MNIDTLNKKKKIRSKKKRGVPKILIYEMRYGKPIYYRDYKKVLSNERSLEEIMGNSGLQSWLINLIVHFLYKTLDLKSYQLLFNEVGYKFSSKSWYNLDIGIWEREKVRHFLKVNKFIQVAPKVVIEIDTKADLKKFENPQDYFHMKTQDLLDSGVEKVVWIFTRDKKVWIAEKKKPWLIVDWDYDIPVIENISVNLNKLIENEERDEEDS